MLSLFPTFWYTLIHTFNFYFLLLFCMLPAENVTQLTSELLRAEERADAAEAARTSERQQFEKKVCCTSLCLRFASEHRHGAVGVAWFGHTTYTSLCAAMT